MDRYDIQVQDQRMGMLTEGALLKTQQKVLKETERTNELLTELLVEVKHANELTRWQIEQQKVAV